jgi:phage terminase large subunit GpA-like protein
MRQDRRVFSVKGSLTLEGKAVVGRPTRESGRGLLFTVSTDTTKGTIYARLKIAVPGPGYFHVPEWADAEFVGQLTAEKALWRRSGARAIRHWKKIRDRNEILDLYSYNLAALHILGPATIMSLEALARQLARPIEEAPDIESRGASIPSLLRRPRRNWVTGWRR